MSTSGVIFSDITCDNDIFCQFILDPTSPNLPRRINLNDSLLESFFQISRDMCFAMNAKRITLIRNLDK